jgi:hypothetical protein
MSFLDKIAGAVMPAESDEERMQARQRAREMGGGIGWLSQAVSHHDQIEAAFTDALGATSEMQAQSSVRQLATLLIAHSVAEEVVLYPVLVMEGHKANATIAYQEQQMAKVQMAELERLTPLTQEWREKLEHIRGAVLHHIYEEESDWFPQIVEESGSTEAAMLDARFTEEFNRSMGKPALA